MDRKSQVSVEYLILTGFVMLAILVPLVIFIYSSANTSVKQTMATEQAAELGDGLVKDAKQIYYLGLYSKKQITYTMPQAVEKFFLLEITKDGQPHYYAGIILLTQSGPERLMFESDVPLVRGDTDPSQGDTADVPECADSAVACVFYYFDKPITDPGKKEFRLENVMEGPTSKVSITSS
jgi:hypothetical protein